MRIISLSWNKISEKCVLQPVPIKPTNPALSDYFERTESETIFFRQDYATAELMEQAARRRWDRHLQEYADSLRKEVEEYVPAANPEASNVRSVGRL